jgi:hypothetical protein
MVIRATFWGPWAFSDSAAYLSAARNIKAGNGAIIQNSNESFSPVTEFPPFFPFFLSIITPFNGDFLLTSRWLNIVLFAISIFTMALICYRSFGKLFPTFLASLLFAFSPLMLDTFTGLMSEPLFITLLLLLVLFLLEFINTEKPAFLIPIFLISFLLPLVRYAGIFFVLCFGFCLFLLRKKDSQKKHQVIPLYIMVALLPIGLWFLNQYRQLNKVGGKRFVINISYLKTIFQSALQEFNIIKGWFPYSGIYTSEIINQVIIILFSFLFILAFFLGLSATIRKRPNKENKVLILFQICIILIAGYFLFIAITHSLTIPKIDIIDRMLAPIYPFLLILLLSSFELLPKERKKWFIKGSLILIALISIRYYGISTFNTIEMLHSEGKGFTSREYQQSNFLKKLNSLPSNQRMISNSAAFVLFHINRFPLQVNQFHNRPYGSGNAYGEKSFRENDAALIILIPEFRNFYGEKSDQYLQSLTSGLYIDYLDEIGGIYFFKERIIPR